LREKNFVEIVKIIMRRGEIPLSHNIA